MKQDFCWGGGGMGRLLGGSEESRWSADFTREQSEKIRRGGLGQWRSQTFLPTGANILFCGGEGGGGTKSSAQSTRVCEGATRKNPTRGQKNRGKSSHSGGAYDFSDFWSEKSLISYSIEYEYINQLFNRTDISLSVILKINDFSTFWCEICKWKLNLV